MSETVDRETNETSGSTEERIEQLMSENKTLEVRANNQF